MDPSCRPIKGSHVLSTLRSRRVALFALAIVVVAAVGETVVSLRGSGSAEVAQAGSVFIPVGQRRAVTIPRVATLAGPAYDSSVLAGHVTVVNFWASWCRPCYAEAPALEQIAREKAGEGVLFLGVDSQESAAETGRLFVADRGVTYPNVFDGDGKVQLAFSRVAQLGHLPVTVVLDANGKVGGVVYGEARYTQLSDLVERVLAGA
jgi:thiol-disulfide isomerase/thioredoxin